MMMMMMMMKVASNGLHDPFEQLSGGGGGGRASSCGCCDGVDFTIVGGLVGSKPLWCRVCGLLYIPTT